MGCRSFKGCALVPSPSLEKWRSRRGRSRTKMLPLLLIEIRGESGFVTKPVSSCSCPASQNAEDAEIHSKERVSSQNAEVYSKERVYSEDTEVCSKERVTHKSAKWRDGKKSFRSTSPKATGWGYLWNKEERGVLVVFPGGSDGKKPARSAGDQHSIPGLGRSPGEGNGNPL